ncbi:MAG: hypothetical protein QNJ75_07400 [Acidimicrobiia bacterium]|nr:hypothetical protein [Acidimicrobiia bacterium]
MPLFPGVEVVNRIAAAGSGFHLNRDQFLANGDNEVQLAPADPEVARNNGGATVLKEASGDALA